MATNEKPIDALDDQANKDVFVAYPISHIVVGTLLILFFLLIGDFIPGGEYSFYTIQLLICSLFVHLAKAKISGLLLDTSEPLQKALRGARASIIFQLVFYLLIFGPPMILTLLASGLVRFETMIAGIIATSEGRLFKLSNLFMIPYVAFSEEVVFRGWIYPAFRSKWGQSIALFGSSILFTIFHAENPFYMLAIFVEGLILAVLVERSKSLIPAVAFHAISLVFATFFFGRG